MLAFLKSRTYVLPTKDPDRTTYMRTMIQLMLVTPNDSVEGFGLQYKHITHADTEKLLRNALQIVLLTKLGVLSGQVPVLSGYPIMRG